jgi:uncharacterized membrane protein
MKKNVSIIGVILVLFIAVLIGCTDIPDLENSVVLEIESYEFVDSTDIYTDSNNYYFHIAPEGYKLLVAYVKISNPINYSKDIDPNRDNIELYTDVSNYNNLNHRDEGSTGKLRPGSSRSNIRIIFEIPEQEIPDKLIFEDKSSESIAIAFF